MSLSKFCHKLQILCILFLFVMASNLHSMQTTSQRKPVQTGAFQIPQVEHHYLSDMSMLAYLYTCYLYT